MSHRFAATRVYRSSARAVPCWLLLACLVTAGRPCQAADLAVAIDLSGLPFGIDLVAPAVHMSGRSPGIRTRLRRMDFKYQMVQSEEPVDLVRTRRGDLARAKVADHLIVQVKPGITERLLHGALFHLGMRVRRHLGRSDSYLVSFPVYDHQSLERARQALEARAEVASVGADWVVHTTVTPNDAEFGQLWGMHNQGQLGGTVGADIKATRAWDITTGSRAVVVGILDTGIDYTHPDLAANMWTNPGESGADAFGHDKRSNGIDDDANGFVDDWRGWDFVNGDNDPMDDNFHGTHCAGTIGAVGGDGLGVAGVCWQVSLVGLKFLNASGEGTISDAVAALQYATHMDFPITSNSWAGGDYVQALKDAIDQAGSRGQLFVAAAGNNAVDTDVSPLFPASYGCDNLIAVAATDRLDQLAYFSCFGATSVDIGAPGYDILSCQPGGGYQLLSGTSMATPHVAGACALLKSCSPALTGSRIKSALLTLADPIPALSGKCVSGGRLNLAAALASVSGPVITLDGTAITEMGNGDGLLNPGETAVLTTTVVSIGSVAVSNAVGRLTCSDPAVTILAGTVRYGSLVPGQTTTGNGTFRVRVAGGTPTPRVLALTLTITSTTGDPRTFQIPCRFVTSSTISGVVTHGPGIGISGAVVLWSGESSGHVVTGTNGAYSIHVGNGAYTLSAYANGFLDSAPVQVTTPPARVVNLHLDVAYRHVPPFTMVVKTDNPGSSTSRQFTLPLSSDQDYDFLISWGDGSTQAITSTASPTHTYLTPGTYTIEISENITGGFPAICFDNLGDRLKLMEITRWGGGTWKTMWAAFCGCTNLTISATDAAKTQGVTDFRRAWAWCSSLTTFPHLDTSAGTDFASAWFDCRGLTSFPALDTSAGTDFRYAWVNCVGLTSFPHIDTALGIDFEGAWFGCEGLTSFPPLDTGSGINFANAWNACRRLVSFPQLDLAAGVDFRGTWVNCKALTAFPLLNTAKGEDFSFAWSGCISLTSLPQLNLTSGRLFSYAWYFCPSLTSFPSSDMPAGTDFTSAWEQCSAMTSFPLVDTSAGITFERAWYGCVALTNFPRLNTSSGLNFSSAWFLCLQLADFPLLDVAAGTDFSYAWFSCGGLTSFPQLDTSAGTDFSYAWGGCIGLTSFPLLNTAQGKNFSNAWYACQQLTAFPALNTGAGENFYSAWAACSALTGFPLLDTSAAISLNSAWVGCAGLTSFPRLNTAACKDFGYAWMGCSGLTDFPFLDTSSGVDFNNAWHSCMGLNAFPPLDLRNMEDGTGCFEQVTLAVDSYDALLNKLSTHNNPMGVVFHGGYSRYSTAAASARSLLTAGRGWTIIDGGSAAVANVSWATPSSVTYGTELTATQLTATADVSGMFSYTPAMGTVLHAGTHALTLVFTPADMVTYGSVVATTTLVVDRASLTIFAEDKIMVAGQAMPALTASGSGFVGTDDLASLDVAPVLATTATMASTPGIYPISVQGASDPDYVISFVNGTMEVMAAGSAPVSAGGGGGGSCGLGGGLGAAALVLLLLMWTNFVRRGRDQVA